MKRRPRNVDPVYRCPKGGFHRFPRRGFMDVFLGFALGNRTTVRTRTCSKCGTVFGAGGTIRR